MLQVFPMISWNSSKVGVFSTWKNSQRNNYSRQALSERAKCCERNERKALLVPVAGASKLVTQLQFSSLYYSNKLAATLFQSNPVKKSNLPNVKTVSLVLKLLPTGAAFQARAEIDLAAAAPNDTLW